MAGQNDVRRLKFEKAFDTFDTDGSGYFTEDDLLAFAEKMSREFGHQPGSAKASAFQQACSRMWQNLRKLDRDNDQKIGKEEYINYLVNASSRDIEALVDPYIDGLFVLGDSDDDQMISKAEFVTHQRVAGVDSGNTSFGKLDEDHDGYLSKSEYRAYMREFFMSTDPSAKGNQLVGGAA